jgi:hypothetical protein
LDSKKVLAALRSCSLIRLRNYLHMGIPMGSKYICYGVFGVLPLHCLHCLHRGSGCRLCF